MDNVPGRDTAVAALALLRCRDRLEQVLETIAEPRRSDLARAINDLDGCDDAQLKHILAEVIWRQDAELRQAAASLLGSDAMHASHAIWQLILRDTVP